MGMMAAARHDLDLSDAIIEAEERGRTEGRREAVAARRTRSRQERVRHERRMSEENARLLRQQARASEAYYRAQGASSRGRAGTGATTARPASSGKVTRPRPSSTSSRSFGDALPMPSLGGGIDRASGKTLILMFTALSALGAVARDVVHGEPAGARLASADVLTVGSTQWGSEKFCKQKGFENLAPYCRNGKPTAPGKDWSKDPTNPAPGNYVLRAPQHLRSLAGVFIVGTFALVLNELNPQLGVAMAGVLLLDVALSVVAPGRTLAGSPLPSLFDSIGAAVFSGGTHTPTAPIQPNNPTGSVLA